MNADQIRSIFTEAGINHPDAGALMVDGIVVDPFLPKDVLNPTLWYDHETVRFYSEETIAKVISSGVFRIPTGTFIYEKNEVRKTGREAVRTVNNRKLILVEIESVDPADELKRWVDPNQLYSVLSLA